MAAAAGRVKVLMTIVVVILFSLATGGKRAVAEVHHVVGDDQGWAPSTDLVSWFTGRVFRVGDKIWFAYTATNESIMELQTADEFDSCDLTNPIRMYTNGLDKVSLDGEGIRYFSSGNLASCKNGLKLPVNVQPREHQYIHDAPSPPTPHFPFPITPPSPPPPTSYFLPPPPPPPPSASAHLSGLSFALFVGFVLCYMGV